MIDEAAGVAELNNQIEALVQNNVSLGNQISSMIDTNQISSYVRDLNPNTSIISVSNGIAKIRMELMKSTDLSSSNWTSASEVVEYNVTATNNVQFYRFNVE